MSQTDTHKDELIEWLWRAAEEADAFEPFVNAWDTYQNAHVAAGTVGEIAASQELVVNFQRAGRTVPEHQPTATDARLDQYLNGLSDPALILDFTGRVHAMHPDIAHLMATTAGPSGPASIVAQIVAEAKGTLHERLIRLETPEGETLLFLLHPMPEEHARTEPLYVLQLATQPWNDGTAALLHDAFGLTQSETDVLRGLYAGLSAGEIAIQRERSIQTVRKQIKTLLEKAQAQDQKHLIRIAAAAARASRPSASHAAPAFTRLGHDGSYQNQVITGPSGRLIEICRYGQPGGAPVLFIQPTTLPVPDPQLAALAQRAGLDIVAVFRPGSGRSAPRPEPDGPRAMVADHLACLDHIGATRAVIAGHCSGGLYALAIAAAAPHRVTGVLTVDTGAPMATMDVVMRMPPTPRRTFVGMRIAPGIMLAPHKMVAADFARGKVGEAKVVEYFFKDSPADQALLNTDQRYWDITRDNLAYCFENVPRLVGDVRRWAQNWQHRANEVQRHISKCALYGAMNTNFSADALQVWCQNEGWDHDIVDDAGQLLIYHQPHRLIDAMQRLHA